ncbi:MAG: sigma-70 family RNA polymerase sigma factor [Lachnospiraceae bacterium]|nr:sigma-70 family RNA polymerase sigma factor [Lachnospiraceae bacterium]
MDDKQILTLYQERSETAISATADKYGKLCHYIAYQILYNEEDSEECVNDTYLKAWEVIPPQYPNHFSAFLGKITRNLAINRYNYYNREKRGKGQVLCVLEELSDCVAASETVESEMEERYLVEVLNRFLDGLPEEKRKIFMRRYWYVSSVKEIAEDFDITESKVKMILLRTRNKLKQVLVKEGFAYE